MLHSYAHEFIFGDDREFASCHASSLAFDCDGRLCACWFGGTKEGADDVAIWFSRRVDGKWTSPQRMSEDNQIPHWNPVLFNTGERLILFYKEGKKIAEWKTMVRESRGGEFSAPRELVPGDTDGGRGPVKNKPIRLRDGGILAPASREYSDGRWRIFTDISRDNGNSWERSEFLTPANDTSVKLIQPSLWQDSEGKLHLLARSDRGVIYKADSHDGINWSEAYPTKLPNNNSGLDLVRSDDGRIFLACNPVGVNWGVRTPLVLLCSEDNGENFTKCETLESEPGEYSYPAIIEKDGKLYITYTWRRERIVFREYSID